MIREANSKDIANIQKIINYYASKKYMLPRSLNELYENTRNFLVEEREGEVIACCGLYIVWEDLAEIKSLAVKEEYRGQHIGERLIKESLKSAKKLKISKVFALTFIPEYFKKLSFKEIDKSSLPHKIWSDCIKCIHFPNCDEYAVVFSLKEI
ncbi:MAG: N-acetyltransferase [bacterium]|nr:N-acetyltransferase [bacterium]